jgi:hypothetical protein
MIKIKVTNVINVYEINGTEIPIGKTETLKVTSHWNDHDLITLDLITLEKDNIKLTVSARQLKMAIDNACNC